MPVGIKSSVVKPLSTAAVDNSVDSDVRNLVMTMEKHDRNQGFSGLNSLSTGRPAPRHKSQFLKPSTLK